MNASAERLKTEAARDQAWTILRDKYDDLNRIYEEGPSQDGDARLVAIAVQVVLGEIRYRASLAKQTP